VRARVPPKRPDARQAFLEPLLPSEPLTVRDLIELHFPAGDRFGDGLDGFLRLPLFKGFASHFLTGIHFGHSGSRFRRSR
jgi:hypothetical protein